MTEKEEPIYVGVENPVEIRRALLESSKSLIKILQENESRRQRREQKHKFVVELKSKIKEINQLIIHLKSELPKIKMSSLPKKAKPEPVVPVVKKEIKLLPKPKPKPIRLSEAQELEKELHDIESKLSRLG
ncbi:hypothetical protein CMO88_02845 [Candidatus Woesearchaeota archaeon]|nr:hypothetical protein [Candidatus Woesearchaeota archaeon]|tara:strand:+ start:34611 stop:35003 length:393 start_codon:yes stop_codon:yes gene_type:complete